MGLLRLISSGKSCSIFRNSRKAITNFRSSSSVSTCSSSSSPSPPWLMLPLSAEEECGGRTFNFYSLAHKKVTSFNSRTKSKSVNLDESEFVGSSHGWIALFNPNNTDLFLFNPLTGHDIKLPPMDTIYTPPDEYTNAWVDKIIITSSPQGRLCRAVMLYNGKRLAYCTPGSSTRWMGPIDPHYTRRVGDWANFGVYEDVVHYPKSDLLLCLGDGLEGWDISSSKEDQLLFNPKSQLVFENSNLLYDYYHGEKTPLETKDGQEIYQKRHLVVHGRQIFLVIRGYYITSPLDRVPKSSDDYPCKTVGFHVHRIGWDGLLGESEADSLGGLAMFVGRNHSFALPAADYPGLMPNSVYFTQHWSSIPRRSPVKSAYGGHDIGVFDYNTKTISPCYYPCDEQSFKRIMPAPMWFTPTTDPCISS